LLLYLYEKRNRDRFPEDFMFQLNKQEFKDLKFQIGTPNLKSQIATSNYGGRRTYPYAFTEQGVAMLSSVLKSKRAVQVNIAIMRAFVRLREIMATHKDLARKIEDLEIKIERFKYLYLLGRRFCLTLFATVFVSKYFNHSRKTN
jgi:phage regulator Rha-like protein